MQNQKTYFTFLLNEGNKKTTFTIDRPKRTTFELAKTTINVTTTADNQTTSITSLTASEAQYVVQQFLRNYKGCQTINHNNMYRIALDQEKGFSILIEIA